MFLRIFDVYFIDLKLRNISGEKGIEWELPASRDIVTSVDGLIIKVFREAFVLLVCMLN